MSKIASFVLFLALVFGRIVGGTPVLGRSAADPTRISDGESHGIPLDRLIDEEYTPDPDTVEISIASVEAYGRWGKFREARLVYGVGGAQELIDFDNTAARIYNGTPADTTERREERANQAIRWFGEVVNGSMGTVMFDTLMSSGLYR